MCVCVTVCLCITLLIPNFQVNKEMHNVATKLHTPLYPHNNLSSHTK